mgnify:CR=1 FL=1|tara:strand:- start:82 stop:1203 length:1122 start_codon:yes stop_codon:yes gene_type:complete
MKFINAISVIVIGILVLFFIGFNFLMIKIDVGEIGVRTKQYAVLGDKGVELEDFKAGWHRNLPMLDVWNIFDSTVQTTEFTSPAERQKNSRRNSLFNFSSRSYNSQGGPNRIELKSKDGYSVRLDVTVKYRILPGKIHLMYKKYNNQLKYKGIVRDQVQKTLRDILGTMRTEEFYNPQIRREKTTIAYDSLKQVLDDRYIELVDILIRDISFDDSYERKILDKKLADQDVELNKSRAVAAEKEGLTNKILAETGAKVKVIEQEKIAQELRMMATTNKEMAQIKADAQLQVAKIKADADLYAAELIARGGLLEKEAEAKGELLRAQALQGSGGKNMVALEAIKGVQLGDITVSTLEVDFLDVDRMIKSFGASAE